VDELVGTTANYLGQRLAAVLGKSSHGTGRPFTRNTESQRLTIGLGEYRNHADIFRASNHDDTQRPCRAASAVALWFGRSPGDGRAG
jgi:hypothetical protein